MPRTSISQVTAHQNCIGCGACAFAAPDSFKIEMSQEGHYVAAKLGEAPEPEIAQICPMSGAGSDETEIAASLYPDLPVDQHIGRYNSTFAGHVAAADYRARGSSGGLISWLAAELLERGEVDAVLHVKPTPDAADNLFGFALSDTPEAVLAGAKSRYYPVTMAELLPTLAASDKRFAVIGLPCFIKSIRLLQKEGQLTQAQVPYTIGLVCGHLKSRYFADYLAWQKGSAPGTFSEFDFRHKIEGRPASRYGFAFRSAASQTVVTPMSEIRGGDWGEGQFKNPACEFCDDVLAECADIAVGDAWLPDYVDDDKGANVVVTRHTKIDQMMREAMATGALAMADIGVGQVVESQSAGLRHRRDGLAHRLARRHAKGIWAPRKRVKPKLMPNILRRWIFDLRWQIAQRSSQEFAQVLQKGGTIADYENRMAPILKRYKALGRGAWRLKRVMKRLRG